MVGWLVGFLTSSSTLGYIADGSDVWQFYVLLKTRQSGETMTTGHFILIPTQLVGSGRPQWESNPGPPRHKSRALPTEQPPPPKKKKTKKKKQKQNKTKQNKTKQKIQNKTK